VTGTNLPFARVILEDFEFIPIPGERPDVVCMVFYDLSTGQTSRLWRDQLNDQLPYHGGSNTLVVSFVSMPKEPVIYHLVSRYLRTF